MKRVFPFAILLAVVLMLPLACSLRDNGSAPTETAVSEPAASEPAASEPAAARLKGFEMAVTYPSRGICVHAAVNMPAREAGESLPLAVILHGHGGSNEGLCYIARALQNAGVASIRMDFSGCGASEESFTENNLINMKLDALAAIAYMEGEYGTDPSRVAFIGFSMGGRVALELVADGSAAPYKLMLIAPAASTKELINLFGGETAWDRMKREAGENGAAEFDAGVIQQLGPEFFAAIERVEDPTEKAAERFSGDALVIWSRDDTIVPAYVSENVAQKLSARTLVFDFGGHLNGLYAGSADPALKRMIEEALLLFAGE